MLACSAVPFPLDDVDHRRCAQGTEQTTRLVDLAHDEERPKNPPE